MKPIREPRASFLLRPPRPTNAGTSAYATNELMDIRLKNDSAGRERFVRVIQTADGSSWDVYEVADISGHPASLIFDCQSVVRRVREYPSDWVRLTDVQLTALMEHL